MAHTGGFKKKKAAEKADSDSLMARMVCLDTGKDRSDPSR